MLEELMAWEHDLCSIKGVSYDKDKVMSSNHSNFDDLIIKICDAQAKINRDIDKLINLKLKAKTEIDKLDDIYYIIMSKRYLQGKRWDEISSETNYSISHIFKLHDDAVKMIVNKSK